MTTPENVPSPVWPAPPPAGLIRCNVHDGTQDLLAKGASRQVSHLVRWAGQTAGASGDTLCGLTRFGPAPDLPGWSMGAGGVGGPRVEQVNCQACWGAGR